MSSCSSAVFIHVHRTEPVQCVTTWTTRPGPRAGKSFQVPSVPTACGRDSPKAIQWIVSIFHAFKAQLAPQAISQETGWVLPNYVKLYQNNMLMHVRSQQAQRRLPEVICALKEWRHYLHGFPHIVKVLVNHKNLTYFYQPQNLNHCQAHWLLDLSNFNLQLHHVPGKDLAGPDALSHHPNHSPADNIDNDNVTLLPHSLFIDPINFSCAGKIATFSDSDPIVLITLSTIEADMPLPFKSKLIN